MEKAFSYQQLRLMALYKNDKDKPLIIALWTLNFYLRKTGFAILKSVHLPS